MHAINYVSPSGRAALDIERVGRGMTLIATSIGRNEFEIRGDSETHYVELKPNYYTCDCGDFEWRSGDDEKLICCKHICSALIEIGDAEALDKMYQWVELDKKRRKEREERRMEREKAKKDQAEARLQLLLKNSETPKEKPR